MIGLRIAAAGLLLSAVGAQAQSCRQVTLTGTKGGPLAFGGLAGSGTLVGFGDVADDCGEVLLQFDTGLGTTQQLSKLGVPVDKLSGVFLTHMHSDSHTIEASSLAV